VGVNLDAIRAYYAGALLSSVLQGVEAEIGKLGRIMMVENSTDATFMSGTSGMNGVGSGGIL